LTEKDFEKIRLKQLSQKLEPSKSRKRKAQEILEQDLTEQEEEEKSEFVTLRDIAFVHKKKKLTREERQAQIMSGRQGREKYGFKKRRLNPHASTTNQEKSKKKAFSMVIQKKTIKRKEKRSFREKQIALRNSLIKRQKSKR
jgi:protein SDA1